MKVVNINRATAENLPWAVNNSHWLISIHSVGKKPAEITAPFGKIFRFEFDDEEEGETAITTRQATEIGCVIRLAGVSNVECLWVHCDGGVSRSGAVVEAAMLLGHKAEEEICNERFPNCRTLNEVRKAMGLEFEGITEDDFLNPLSLEIVRKRLGTSNRKPSDDDI